MLYLTQVSFLRCWYNSINTEPGFTDESFNALKNKVDKAVKNDQKVICSLMIDEIGIKKGTQRSRDGKVYGHVDFGASLEIDDNSQEATDALVFMVVGVNGNWTYQLDMF